MPHCQKENHNHATKSKKERLKLKQEAQARKQRLREAAVAAEAEAALKLTNNIAPVEGHGEYEVGYEPEPEYTRFNVKKRSKKHLRNDLRKRMLREQREEEERIRKAQEEEYRKQKQQENDNDDDEEEEEEDEEELELEYFVFICECCDKRYATKNQFLNHIHSKKHKRKCRIYEDLGLLVTHIELRGENGNEKQVYNDDDDDDDDEDDDDDDDDDDDEDDDDNEEDAKDSKKKNNNNNNNEGNKNKNTARVRGTCSNRNGTKNNNDDSNDDSNDDDESDDNHSEERSESESEDESEDDDDEYYVAPSRSKNVFAGFATGFGDDSTSSSSEEEDNSNDDDEEREEDETRQPRAAPPKVEDASDDEESDIDFDELIRQNQLLQKELDAKQKEEQAISSSNNNGSNNNGNGGKELVVPLPFHETYDPDDYDTNEQRLVSVQHRLRKNLASRGIAPKKTRAPTAGFSSSYGYGYDYDPLDAIAMGKTLLQQVLESNTDTLQQRLEAYRRHKKDCELVAREFALARGNSKALPAQYVHKQDAADNARFRANVHHAGSHYHMQMARSMQFGRHKGMMARHSSQGARLQASRMAMASGGGANKVGKKTSKKKSQQKRRGEAGGSKKTGGYKGGDGGD
eukprot:CAMPEP_0172410096 /NCGR_PEP_ID=MMETSP1061-20121228/76703_1 /TAXON_ID=37318 /ORGANISM="Pseudo-nitzschia pungens, Strain cf. pungens" /LENGTH=630 /DNA_ID=CAMNT_0013146265 /DNA_START=86 /DNA_END=1978 /DNA_ORIENTATION=-